MIVVIIAGGSGTRLWPLSTSEYPKHLLKINDDKLSLLQHTYERAKKLTNKIYIVSEAGHIKHVKDQISDLSEEAFIVEPARRGTANCIIAALEHISRQQSSDEIIAFSHADHYIRDTAGFVHSFLEAERISAMESRIVLVGIEPDQAAVGFGYIEKGGVYSQNAFIFNVRSFTEKPDYKLAKRYFQSGNYLWNGGYFVGSIRTFLNKIQQFAPELAKNYERLAAASPNEYKKTYLSLKSAAIDYALIENVPDLLVVPASFDWMDLGSFGDLAKAVSGDELGNYTHGQKISIDEVKNSFMYSDEDKPIVIIGLDNVIVVNTPQGLLITRKDLSQKVGELSKRALQDTK